jgi:hypothetical protein
MPDEPKGCSKSAEEDSIATMAEGYTVCVEELKQFAGIASRR